MHGRRIGGDHVRQLDGVPKTVVELQEHDQTPQDIERERTGRHSRRVVLAANNARSQSKELKRSRNRVSLCGVTSKMIHCNIEGCEHAYLMRRAQNNGSHLCGVSVKINVREDTVLYESTHRCTAEAPGELING